MSIAIENLYFTYMKNTPFEMDALKKINLKVEEGESIAIIGSAGSGKTTLVQMIKGLIKPTAGKISINEMNINENYELTRKVGLVFQFPEHQLFEDTVGKDIAFGLKDEILSHKEKMGKVLKAMELAGLGERYIDRSTFHLSSGEMRKAAIAGVLVMEPEILLMDEPTSGLDTEGREEIIKLINFLNQKRKMTIIAVTHNIEDAVSFAKRIIVMKDGCIVFDRKADEAFKDLDYLWAHGIKGPQIACLMRKIKSFKPDINDNIFTVKEAKIELLRFMERR
jgi:energy-coupling factor transport system ATP-binding protein